MGNYSLSVHKQVGTARQAGKQPSKGKMEQLSQMRATQGAGCHISMTQTRKETSYKMYQGIKTFCSPVHLHGRLKLAPFVIQVKKKTHLQILPKLQSPLLTCQVNTVTPSFLLCELFCSGSEHICFTALCTQLKVKPTNSKGFLSFFFFLSK